MSSIGTSKGILEIGKFAFYVSIPIDLMYTLANNSENMKKLVQKDCGLCCMGWGMSGS
uniref:Uncharacterized protein n=1 Tax=Vitis vinifera TaxID=29760 RepID=F6I3E1_VITVI